MDLYGDRVKIHIRIYRDRIRARVRISEGIYPGITHGPVSICTTIRMQIYIWIHIRHKDPTRIHIDIHKDPYTDLHMDLYKDLYRDRYRDHKKIHVRIYVGIT